MSKENKFKEFFATSWAIDNRTSVYVLAILISILGMMNYYFIPKEQFPQVVIPYIIVSTPYPGTSPEDIENLVTRPIEKQLKSIADVKNVTSNSVPDFSSIIVEFDPSLSIETAKQRVRDAVDKSKSDLPTDLPEDPSIMDVDISAMPVMYLNISGNYDLNKLKHYAEIAQDRIEGLKEITRVEIVGALDREIQINADIFKMQAAKVTFGNIEQAVAMENLTISGGSLVNNGVRNTVRIKGQFTDVQTIKDIVVHSSSGAFVKLSDIAEVKDSFKEQESFARLDGKNVITLNVIKKNGANLLDASDQIVEIVADLKEREFPKGMDITITGDQSLQTRNTLEELNNTIIIGFILVTIVLMFFMGFTNAFFVGLSVPLSMFVAYLIIPGLGFTMNMMVMFAFIFALGIVVDDAIVVIENTHRLHRFNPDINIAAKKAAGEVFLPILSGTLTTLAPFFPLAFWPGIVGQFMHYLPVTLIITLFASLFVAYVFNPVFAVSFMKHEYDQEFQKGSGWKKLRTIMIVMLAFAGVFYATGVYGLANFLVFGVLMILFFHFILKKMITGFQEKTWPWIMGIYERQLRMILKGARPIYILVAMIALFFVTIFITGVVKPTVLFFPDSDPNNIYVYVKMPGGTDQNVTDSITSIAEERVYKVMGKNNPDVESIISNVTIGAEEQGFVSGTGTPFNKGKVSINFIEHKLRSTGISTTEYLEILRKEVKDIPGAEISVDKDANGPPTGKPINIEITSENLGNLVTDAYAFRDYLKSMNIPGVEELKTDFEMNSPEIIIQIDRDRAQRLGISTGQIGMEIRTALYGKEISKLKQEEDEYPIMLRYKKVTRDNIDALVNLEITYRDMNSGMLRSIPLSTVAKIDYTSSYAGIKRLDQKRVITVYSNVLSGYSANDIVPIIKREAKNFTLHEGTNIKLTGEQDDQAETVAFLLKAMIIAIGAIFFILITQFGSVSKSLIILSEVIFSIIGVLLGVMLFRMDLVIMMTGLGVVALGGIVVRNGILIVEFIDAKIAEGMPTRRAIIEGGKTRMTPVILTATATMLGLVPLAVGLNINFATMFTELNPHIYFGGDNVAFWGPLAWSIIFGLSFATFLTLMFVPALYELDYTIKLKMKKRKNLKRIKELNK
ncbi:MAG: efflux RND transporter permease subunit [Prolixibacteraceae bacterium]|nr:efflux RND transporter permease subunit [Prolixibacteraceae bacterium]